MPIIKGAIKKLRQDRARTTRNKAARTNLATTLKTVRVNLTEENLAGAFSALDKAVKTNLIKKAKADRIKSRLSKSVAQAKPVKKTVSKVLRSKRIKKPL